MQKNALVKTFLAGAAIAANTLVKFSADNTVVAAAAATDDIIGVSDLGADGSGDRVDVVLFGPARVKAGGAITRGKLITSDANGKAVACAPAAGTSARAIGVVQLSAADGDLVDVVIAPSVVTTPAA